MTPRKSKPGNPFQVVEDTWSVDTAAQWVFRSYLPQTLSGVLNAIFTAANQADVQAGFAHIPSSLHDSLDCWPDTADSSDSNLLTWNKKTGWEIQPQPFSHRSNLGTELWMAWSCPSGFVLAVAKRVSVRRPIKIRSADTWQFRLSWHPDNVSKALSALQPVMDRYPELVDEVKKVGQTFKGDKIGPCNEAESIIRSALTLADHMDPWTRRNISDSNWIVLYNRVQEKVGWELMVDKLMPAIADVLSSTLSYDFFELLIFSRVGKRYEEFLSYRRNNTDYGGKSMNLLLDARLVEKVIEEQKPRLISTTQEAGLMNPHLAQLAQLREGLLVPLVHDKQVHGMISLYYRKKTELTDSELVNISHIGRVLARSIENTNAHETVRRLATIDGLTGLYNRRSFTDMISREMRRILRYKQYFSLILVDIDNFKNYNDNNGHLMGDQLLSHFSQVMKTCVREQDMVARYGGEEFAVILPHTDANRGMVVAEKIRNMISETDFPHGETQPLGYVSISAGVADSLGGVKTYQELIDRADRALYRAKESGRDRSLMYSPELDSDSK